MDLMLALVHEEPTCEGELDCVSADCTHFKYERRTYYGGVDSRPCEQDAKIESNARM